MAITKSSSSRTTKITVELIPQDPRLGTYKADIDQDKAIKEMEATTNELIKRLEALENKAGI